MGRHNAARSTRAPKVASHRSPPSVLIELGELADAARTHRSGTPHGISAADLLAARAAEFARTAELATFTASASFTAPRRSRAAERTLASRPLWRRTPLVPVLATVLAVCGSAETFSLVSAQKPAAASRTAADVPVDLSAIASGEQLLLQRSGEQVSRSKRTTSSGSTSSTGSDTAGSAYAAGSSSLLPARPDLPRVTDGKTVPGTWIRPSAGGESSCFCMRWGVMHDGIDLAGPLGSPIVAVGDGVVLQAGPVAGFGHWIVIQHSNGDVSVYGHMYSVLVSVGERVVAGQHIADIGSDGQSTGPHLHFGVMSGGYKGPYIDPVPWLKARGISVGSYSPNA